MVHGPTVYCRAAIYSTRANIALNDIKEVRSGRLQPAGIGRQPVNLHNKHTLCITGSYVGNREESDLVFDRERFSWKKKFDETKLSSKAAT